MKQSTDKAKLEASLQAVLQDFYNSTIVPNAEAQELDPIELFTATVKGALESKYQDKIDEQRSSFFTLKS